MVPDTFLSATPFYPLAIYLQRITTRRRPVLAFARRVRPITEDLVVIKDKVIAIALPGRECDIGDVRSLLDLLPGLVQPDRLSLLIRRDFRWVAEMLFDIDLRRLILRRPQIPAFLGEKERAARECERKRKYPDEGRIALTIGMEKRKGVRNHFAVHGRRILLPPGASLLSSSKTSKDQPH